MNKLDEECINILYKKILKCLHFMVSGVKTCYQCLPKHIFAPAKHIPIPANLSLNHIVVTKAYLEHPADPLQWRQHPCETGKSADSVSLLSVFTSNVASSCLFQSLLGFVLSDFIIRLHTVQHNTSRHLATDQTAQLQLSSRHTVC